MVGEELGNNFTVIIVMGVSGSGKTTIGRSLAKRLGWDFIESDEYHSPQDIEKMSGGIPLTDEDRWPWLRRLHDLLLAYKEKDRSLVLACSALKQSYRDMLISDLENAFYVYLQGDYDLIHHRMQQRQHYMKAGMLRSQFDALEEPQDGMTLDIQNSPEEIVDKILAHLPDPT